MTFGIDIGAGGVRFATGDRIFGLSHPPSLAARLPDIVDRAGDRIPLVYRDDAGEPRSSQARDLFVELAVSALQSSEHQTDPTELGRGGVVVPGWWSRRVTDLVREMLAEAGLGEHGLVVDSVAAVRGHALESADVPQVLAVLDVGQWTSAVSVLQGCDGTEPQLVGVPAVIFESGGAQLDALILHHVLGGLGPTAADLDRTDVAVVEAASLLRDHCRRAKEILSAETATTIAVELPGLETRVRLVRSELDEIARPWAHEIVSLLREELAGSRVEVDAVLMVGGGSHVPLLAQMISAELGLPVIKDQHPEVTTLRGAVECATPDRAPRRRGVLRRPNRRPGRRQRRRDRKGTPAVVEVQGVEAVAGEDAAVDDRVVHELAN